MIQFKTVEELERKVRLWPYGVRCAIAFGLLILVSYLDYSTPSYISVTGFYFLPMFLAVWFCGLGATLLMFVLSAGFNIAETVSSTAQKLTAEETLLSVTSLLIVHAGFAFLIYLIKGIVFKLEAESRTDALTGLKNRRGFIEILERENLRKKRFGQGLVLVSLDIDNFKSVNDHQGHAVGDELLVAVGGCLETSLRDVDVSSRLGGDEFLALLPGTSKQEAEPVLRRLHEQLRPIVQGFGADVGVSVGALVVPGDSAVSTADILNQADALMYSVKRRGKNDLVIADASTGFNTVQASAA